MVLLKDTSLVSVISLTDILRQTSVAARVTKEPFLFYGVACLIYLALAIISSYFIARIEKWAEGSRKQTASSVVSQ
jgi:polar amino acid transport system permease protein